MLLHKFISKRFILGWVLVTAVLALSVQTALPQTESETPRPAERVAIPYLETTEAPLQTDQTVAAADLVPHSKLVFQSYRDLNWEIYSGNDDNSGQTRLTTITAADIHPRFNRGLTRIVFASKRYGNYEIFTMNPDGTGVVQLTNNSSDDGNPYWSPDGSRIVFEAYRDGQAEIYVMNADGSGQTRLTSDGDFDGYPYWSQDGSKIAFTSRRTGGYRIYSMNIDGSGLVQLSEQPYSFNASWSPDGTQIAYDADADGDGWQELWLMNADGSNQHLIVDPSGTVDTWARDWSPDGRYIAFTLVIFTNYQGNWYWTNAYLHAYDSVGHSTYNLSLYGLDWHPDWQTADVVAPTSGINPLPFESPNPFSVSWVGSDDITGIKGYDVQVKVGANGTWTDWLVNTTDTSAVYDGIAGETYYFRVRARDNAHNVEQWPASYGVFTTIESRPPNTAVSSLSAYSRADRTLTVYWGGEDPGNSGIVSYDIQYRINNGNWVNWLTGITDTKGIFDYPTPGTTYYFRSRATDYAHNTESWPSGDGDAQTTIYTWGITGQIFDNTNTPVEQAVVTTNPTAFTSLLSDYEGTYGAYVLDESGTYDTSWNKPGYGAVPQTTFPYTTDASINIVLPPIDNIITNEGFETGSIAPDWSASGTITPVLTTTTRHTGQYAAFLGQNSDGFANPLYLAEYTTGNYYPFSPGMVASPDGTIHLAWEAYTNSGYYIYYMWKDASGIWSAPAQLSPGEEVQLAVDTAGNVHAVWGYGGFIKYAWRNSQSDWSTPINISGDTVSSQPLIAINNINQIHVAFTTHSNDKIYHVWRNTSGTWSEPQIVHSSGVGGVDIKELIVGVNKLHLLWESPGSGDRYISYTSWQPSTGWFSPQVAVSHSYAYVFDFVVDLQDRAHLTWTDMANINYTYQNGDGSWVDSEALLPQGYGRANMAVSADNTLHLISDAPDGKVYYAQRPSGGNWSIFESVSQDLTNVGMPGLFIDEEDNIHVAFSSDYYTDNYLFYTQRVDGIWQTPQKISSDLVHYALPHLYVDENDTPHIIWQHFWNENHSLYYIGPEVNEIGGDSAVSQSITIPITLSTPFLSFMYQLNGVFPDAESELTVAVHDGISTTPVLTLDESTHSWEHAWIDMSSWVGQSVTVTFNLHQADGEPIVNVYLDDVSLGSASPDNWVTVNSTIALPGEQTVHTLTYGNQGGAASENGVITYTLPADISFVSASVLPTSVNGSVLVWEVGSLPAKSEPFTIVVTGTVSLSATPFEYLTSTAVIATPTTELETLNNVAVGQTFIGRFTYLPVVFKN